MATLVEGRKKKKGSGGQIFLTESRGNDPSPPSHPPMCCSAGCSPLLIPESTPPSPEIRLAHVARADLAGLLGNGSQLTAGLKETSETGENKPSSLIYIPQSRKQGCVLCLGRFHIDRRRCKRTAPQGTREPLPAARWSQKPSSQASFRSVQICTGGDPFLKGSSAGFSECHNSLK